MKVAKEDITEVYKDITSQMVRSAPELSNDFAIYKKVRSRL